MADPITPTTPIPNFTLNLEPNTQIPAAQSAPESVVKENDDRLQKEDKLVEQQVQPEETPVVEVPVVETPVVEAPKVETIPEVKIEETPAVKEIPAPSAFQKDLQIIQTIHQTQAPVITPVAPVQIPTTPTVNSFNLDNITTQIPTAPQIPGINSPMGNIPTAPQIPLNPYDHLTNYIPQIAPNTQIPAGPISAIKKSSKTGTEIGIGVGVGFMVLAWFVIKTMYPIQYKDAMGGMFGGDEEGITTAVITTSLTGGDMTGDNILSGELGDISFGSGDGSLDELTGSHSVAIDTGSIVDTGTITMTPEAFKTQMETYSSQGKIATLKAKKTNDKTLIANSLAIYKKAEAVLQDIANGKEITTDDMNAIITELSGYLDTLNPSSDATPSTTEKPINTGSSDFNPDAFFGANGNSQN